VNEELEERRSGGGRRGAHDGIPDANLYALLADIQKTVLDTHTALTTFQHNHVFAADSPHAKMADRLDRQQARLNRHAGFMWVVGVISVGLFGVAVWVAEWVGFERVGAVVRLPQVAP